MAEIAFDKLHQTLTNFAADFAANDVDTSKVKVKLIVDGRSLDYNDLNVISLADISYTVSNDSITLKLSS